MSKGWRYESNRHALAARGIKSGRIKTTVHTTHTLDEKYNLSFPPVDESDIIVKEYPDGTTRIFYLVQDDMGGMSTEDIMGDSGELIRGDDSRNRGRGQEIIDTDPLAVVISVYKHSGEAWFLPENRQPWHDMWDTAEVGGIWIPSDYLRKELEELPEKDREKQARKYAQQFLDEYNAIISGDVYMLVSEQYEKGEHDPINTDNVGLIIGSDYARRSMKESAEAGELVV